MRVNEGRVYEGRVDEDNEPKNQYPEMVHGGMNNGMHIEADYEETFRDNEDTEDQGPIISLVRTLEPATDAAWPKIEDCHISSPETSSKGDISANQRNGDDEPGDLLYESMDDLGDKVDDLGDKDDERRGGNRENLDKMPKILAIKDTIKDAIKDIGENAEKENKKDDGDEEDEETPLKISFSLKEKLTLFQQEEIFPNPDEMVLEVLKCRGDDLLDMRFLYRKERYYSLNEFGRFCLAENRGPYKFHFFFTDQYKGKIQFSDNYCMDLEKLCLVKDLYRKKERVYRCLLPMNAVASFHDGSYDYYLRLVKPDQSPQVQSPQFPESVREERQFVKSLIKSVIFHILIIIFAGLFLSF